MPGVSAAHAVLRIEAEQLLVEDLGSTNGTRVNGLRILSTHPLRSGDVVEFGDSGFTVEGEGITASGLSDTLALANSTFSVVEQARRMESLLCQRRLRSLYQPIVDLSTNQCFGYECLARGTLDGLPENPEELFALAALRHVEVELSVLCRQLAIDEIAGTPSDRDQDHPSPSPAAVSDLHIFTNVHPAEVHDERFLTHLHRLREVYPNLRLVAEIHERSILDPLASRRLLEAIRGFEVSVAYDDFGAGAARLTELAECPPDYLKFDRSLIAELKIDNPRMLGLVRSLVAMARDLGTKTVAEGIETEEQLDLCSDLGFDLAQGYLLGRPEPWPASTP